jgi:hypothetical protein
MVQIIMGWASEREITEANYTLRNKIQTSKSSNPIDLGNFFKKKLRKIIILGA